MMDNRKGDNHRGTEGAEGVMSDEFKVDYPKREFTLPYHDDSLQKQLAYLGINDFSDNPLVWRISPLFDFEKVITRVNRKLKGIAQ